MGVHDVYGNVWEWTEDHFNGLPGFKTNYLYDDYSTPSFDSRHTMIMVSSTACYKTYCFVVHNNILFGTMFPVYCIAGNFGEH